jgi:osmotically-inducible protein OsmY
MGDQLQQFGSAMAGRVRRMFRSPKGYKRSDDRIREDICDQLSQQSQLDPGEIEVSVSGGEVTLSGSVPERYMKWQAEQVIDNVSGVNEIHNQLRVQRQDTSTSASSQQAGGMTGTPANTQGGTRSQARS